MSRTIGDLDLGTTVMIEESGTAVPYIIVRKDSAGVVVLRYEIAETRRMHSSNVSVYTDCEMDTYLCDETDGYLSRFDANTLGCLAERGIDTFTYGDSTPTTINRKCYLLSWGDLFTDDTTGLYTEGNICKALTECVGSCDMNKNRIAQYAGSNTAYWTRSASSASQFFYCNHIGTSNYSLATNTFGVRPALNVASATIVSDEGADVIYLNPTARECKSVEFKGLITESQSRPVKAVPRVDSSNMTNVVIKMTNNYGDAEPVWVTVENGEIAEFENESLETEHWQLGIWITGDTVGYTEGYFEEPSVTMEVE